MNRRSLAIGLIAALALVGASVLVFSAGRGERSSDTTGTQTPQVSAAPVNPQALADASKNLEAIQLSFREVAKKVLPVVVEVDVSENVTRQTPMQNPFDWFFNQQQPGNGRQQQFTRQGLGSGILVRKDGDTYYVLTNNHVVNSATSITVKLNDQRTFTAKVRATDANRDLALVYFTSKDNLPTADLGDSDQIQVGDLVLAVGNPFGFENTVTMGIVSALGRSSPRTSGVAQNTDYIQTDASINEGNSGGALVNVRGEVIGINAWIAAPTGGSIGLGFAIPINNAKRVIDDFIAKGKAEYGFLGVIPADVQASDPNTPSYFGVARDMKIENVKGSFVLNVYTGSPADASGVLPGDFITKVNGQAIDSTNKLVNVVGNLLAGKTYDFELIRAGTRMTVPVKLAVRPADGSDSLAYRNLWPGMTVIRINDQVRNDPNISIARGMDGVMVAVVMDAGNGRDNQSPAAIAGLQTGDVITQINGKDVRTVADFYRYLGDKSKNVTFKINRSGTELTIGITR